MDKLRDFLQTWPGRILMLLCIAPMALMFGSAGGSNQSANQVAKVGDGSVSLDHFQTSLLAMRQELLSQGIDASLIDESVLKDQVLKDLVDRLLLSQQSNVLGMNISDETITKLLKQEKGFQDADGKFSNELFGEFLASRQMNKNQLFSEFRNRLALSQLNGSVVSNSIYPSSVINQLIEMQTESRNVWIHRFNWQDYQDKVMITDSEITKYYDQHKDELKSVEAVDLSYIELSPESIQIDAITDEELQLQYEAYKQKQGIDDMRQISHILLTGDDAKSKAKEIQKKLAAGAKFSDVAKKYSDDISAQSGGDIGRFNPQAFGADSAKVKKALKGLIVGDVSKPVITSYGLHIFKVTSEDTDNIPSLESLRNELMASAKQYKKQTLFSDKVKLINDMATDGYSIQDIAKQENIKVKVISNYSKENNTTALNQPLVVKSVFDDFVIQELSVTTAVEVSDKTLWLQPSNYRPVKSLSRQKATPMIKSILIQKKSTKLALADAKASAKKIKDKSDIMKQGFIFSDLGAVNRQSNVVDALEKSAIFKQADSKNGINSVVVKTDKGASIMVVGNMTNIDKSQISDEDRLQKATIVRNKIGQQDMADYLDYLRLTQGVEINQDALKSDNP